MAIYQGSHVNHESHSSEKRSFALTAFAGPVNYSINIYPTQTFSDQFHTNYPYYVMCFAVLVVLFTSSIFLLYDYMMTRSATERELVMEIETKRLFVRYISHEIRTPLQTIASEFPCSHVPIFTTYHMPRTMYNVPLCTLHSL
jgi:signal transduction histidine kinase